MYFFLSSCFETYLFYVAALFPLGCSAVFVLSPLCFLQDTVLCEFIFAFFVPKISSFCHSEQFMSVSSSFFLPNLLHLLLLSKVLAQLASPKVAAPSMLTQCGHVMSLSAACARRCWLHLCCSHAPLYFSLFVALPPLPPPSLIFIYKALFSLLDLCSQVHPWLHSKNSPSSSSFHLQQRFHYIRSKHNSFIPSSPISSLFSLSYQNLGFLKSPLHLHAFIYPLGCCCRQCAAPGSALLPLPWLGLALAILRAAHAFLASPSQEILSGLWGSLHVFTFHSRFTFLLLWSISLFKLLRFCKDWFIVSTCGFSSFRDSWSTLITTGHH